MSTLKTNTLSNAAGSKSVPVDTVVDGTAKAWVNFNGTGTVAIRASFNVSSITDNGTGDYTVNFTTAMTDANYSVNGFSDGAGGLALVLRSGGVSFSSSNFRAGVFTTAGANVDKDTVCFSVFR